MSCPHCSDQAVKKYNRDRTPQLNQTVVVRGRPGRIVDIRLNYKTQTYNFIVEFYDDKTRSPFSQSDLNKRR